MDGFSGRTQGRIGGHSGISTVVTKIPELMGTIVRVRLGGMCIVGMMLSLLYCTYGFDDQYQMIFDGQGRSEP